MQKYTAFLRGINVGGHHKIPMADLRMELEELGFENVITLLNSGNVILDSGVTHEKELERTIAEHLESRFGFPVPTIVRSVGEIKVLWQSDPFKDIEITKDIRLYVSFLKDNKGLDIELPWTSTDGSCTILAQEGKTIITVLDLAISGTPKGMEALERFYGKDITTRNWKTIGRIVSKI